MNEGQRRADEFLRVIRDEEKLIRNMAEKVMYLKYKASGGGAIRYDKDRVQTSPEDMISSAMAEAVDMERRIIDIKYDVTERRIKANAIIHSWEDREGMLLAYLIMIYYMDNGSMRDAARELQKSERQTYRMRLDALERFSKEL